MTTATPNPRTMAALVARQKQQRIEEGLAAELRHQVDPCDSAFARLACTHPEACATESGDPEWDAWIARRIAETNPAWAAAHQTGGTA